MICRAKRRNRNRAPALSSSATLSGTERTPPKLICRREFDAWERDQNLTIGPDCTECLAPTILQMMHNLHHVRAGKRRLLRGRGISLLAQRFDQPLHAVFLPFDRFQQLELRAAAVEVVIFPMNLEVGVAAEMICEKANADFESDELA